MPDLHSEHAPMSDAVTHSIRVEVLSRHSPENSRQGEWIFEYTVRITNQGTDTEQPVLAPGESFKYSSWCPLKTPTGVMRGTYQMVRAGGERFDIEIAPFGLKARYTVH